MSDILEINRANGRSSLEWAKELLVDYACTIVSEAHPPLSLEELKTLPEYLGRALLLPNADGTWEGRRPVEMDGEPIVVTDENGFYLEEPGESESV